MGHMLRFRKGWQSEHIAKFILSRFCFVAEPSTIADDIGSDFICTLFNVENDEYLIPQSSFAIQIKSNRDTVDISKKFSYFFNLELPYFVGVVNKEKLTIRVYSGESIPHFFSCYPGKIKNGGYKAMIRLIDDPPNRYHNFISCDDLKNECYLDFPFIAEFSAKGSIDIGQVSEVCKLIQFNISSRSTKSYYYYLYGWEGVNIYTGSGSIKTFRNNFLNRLAEALLNLEWILDNMAKEFNYSEYEMYKSVAESFIDKYEATSGILNDVCSRIDSKIGNQMMGR